jgi:3,4-dihydroxy 2-butanone 4-phosphate synthase / GTP cyclohydrolase II
VFAISQILDEIAQMPQVTRLEFMVANGPDPSIGLQTHLDRQTYPKSQLPSTLNPELELQVIYSFM